MKNRRFLPLIIYLIALVLIFSWVNGLFSKTLTRIPYSEIVNLFKTEQVRAFVVDGQTIQLELRTPDRKSTRLNSSHWS